MSADPACPPMYGGRLFRDRAGRLGTCRTSPEDQPAGRVAGSYRQML